MLGIAFLLRRNGLTYWAGRRGSCRSILLSDSDDDGEDSAHYACQTYPSEDGNLVEGLNTSEKEGDKCSLL